MEHSGEISELNFQCETPFNPPKIKQHQERFNIESQFR